MTLIVTIDARRRGNTEELERELDRRRDDADVQPGDRENVREAGGGEAVANLRRQIAAGRR